MTPDHDHLPVSSNVELSAIVPISIRHVDIKALHAQYRDALASISRNYEIIYVIDGGFGEVIAGLDELLRAGEKLTAVYLTRTFGESTALMAGFEQTRGAVIVTLPAYYQIDPADIGKLVAALGSADMAVACRWPRVGGPAERLRRWAFHGLVQWMTGLSLHDLGCSARAMKRQVLEEISLYGDQHRLLPALADRQGFRVQEIQVRQSPQDRYSEGYRTREYAHRLLDLFAVFFLVRFTKKPLRFFGMVGASTLCIGTALVLYLVVARLFLGESLANRPALLLSSLLVVLGLQLFALGLLGELIIFTHARGLKDYQVDRVIEFHAADHETA
jgi:glycosyltransferase involved in cell wall biosynthesis